MNIRGLFSISITLLLTACGSLPRVAPVDPQQQAQARQLAPKPGKALVYFIRPYYFAGCGVTAPVEINKIPFGNVDVRTFIYAHVDPGMYIIGFPGPGAMIAPKQIQAKEGETYYLICTGNGIVGINGINQISAEAGLKVIQGYKLSGDLFYEQRKSTPNVN